MKKREIKIINFLNLSEEKYMNILEYRNQEYIRNVSLNTNYISIEDHKKYFELLVKKDNYFAFLITNDNKDYSVINLKKINNNTYYIGDYLVKEEFKFEGGGVVNRFCVQYICNKLDIKYLTSDVKYSNTRTFRSGKIGELISREIKDETFSDTIEIFDFFNKDVLNSKARKMFDKLYEIIDFQF